MDSGFPIRPSMVAAKVPDQSAALARLAAMSNNANARMFALELAAVTAPKNTGSDSPSPQNITLNTGPKLSAFAPAGSIAPGTTSAGSSVKSSKAGKSSKPTKAPSRKR